MAGLYGRQLMVNRRRLTGNRKQSLAGRRSREVHGTGGRQFCLSEKVNSSQKSGRGRASPPKKNENRVQGQGAPRVATVRLWATPSAAVGWRCALQTHSAPAGVCPPPAAIVPRARLLCASCAPAVPLPCACCRPPFTTATLRFSSKLGAGTLQKANPPPLCPSVPHAIVVFWGGALWCIYEPQQQQRAGYVGGWGGR